MIIIETPNVNFVFYKREIKALEVSNSTLVLRFKDSKISVFAETKVNRLLCKSQLRSDLLKELRKKTSQFKCEFFRDL